MTSSPNSDVRPGTFGRVVKGSGYPTPGVFCKSAEVIEKMRVVVLMNAKNSEVVENKLVINQFK
jgi:hypothetical protein